MKKEGSKIDGGPVVVEDASQATILQLGSAEIDQQPEREVEQPQVCMYLAEMDGQEPLCRLELNDHDSVDQEIHAQALVVTDVTVLERYHHMPVDLEVPCFQLSTQYGFVYRFEEPRTEIHMQPYGSVHDLRGNTFRLG